MSKSLVTGLTVCAALVAFAGNADAHKAPYDTTRTEHASPPPLTTEGSRLHADCVSPALASCMSSPYDRHDFGGKPNG
jgi:hypothetical protein